MTLNRSRQKKKCVKKRKNPFLSIEIYDQRIRLTVKNALKNALHFRSIHFVVCQTIEYQIELIFQLKLYNWDWRSYSWYA